MLFAICWQTGHLKLNTEKRITFADRGSIEP